MSYQVLARKWRPKNFTQLMGQEHVVTVLVNALMQERLHHAYLFTGTRGVGKTTIARIFAKSLNCQEGITANPCGKCDICEDVDAGRFVDLLEIDAASRTKVDDTREILDNVQYAPSRGRFKVYLIDEVHMLSKSSFNALLKTLEEPPPHVKFILATTDPQKLPVTVLSRCLQFHLKALTPQQIEDKLSEILTAEEVTHEPGALTLLAKAARGSMRDSLSLTDQAIAQGQGHIEIANLQQMLGGVDQNWVFKILISLIKQDAKGLLELSKNIASYAPSYHRLLAELLQLLHQVALWQLVPNSVDVDAQRATLLTKFASAMSPEDVQLYYQIVLNGRKDLAYSFDEQAGFDMVILRMLAFKPATLANTVSAAAIAAPADTSFDDVELVDTVSKVATVNKAVSQVVAENIKAESVAPVAVETTVVSDSGSQINDSDPLIGVDALNAEQQQLEVLAEQAKAQVAATPSDVIATESSTSDVDGIDVDDLFASNEVESPIQAETSAPQASAPEPVLEQAPEQASAPEPVLDQAPEQEQAAEPEVEQVQQQVADPVPASAQQPGQPQSDVDKMLATRNMLRSRKKLSEGSAKKPVAKVASKPATTATKDDNSNSPLAKLANAQVNQATVNVPSMQATMPDASVGHVSNAKVSAAKVSAATVSDSAVSKVAQTTHAQASSQAFEQNSAAQKLTEPNTTEQNTTEQKSAEQTTAEQAQASLPDVSHLTLNSFSEADIDPAIIRDANQIDVWANTIDAMGLGGRVRQLALNANMGEQSNAGQLVIHLDKKFEHLNSPAALEQITQAYSALKNQHSEVNIDVVDNTTNSPFNIQMMINSKRLAYAKDIIANDKFVQHLQSQFDAFVEDNSVEPL
ncbi:DNA polymerase III subunit gamma/tau [Colwelliaceae bacterium BS250]